MKNVLQFFVLFACICGVLTGCDKSTTPGGGDAIELTLSVDKNSIIEGSETIITVKASREVETPLVINVASDNASVAVPTTVTIEAGKDVATVSVKGISKGSAKITITAEDVTYTTQSVDVTVTEEIVDTTPVLKVEIASTSVTIGDKVPFLITTLVALESDLTIKLISDKPEFVEAPESVVLKSGQLEVEIELTAVAVGDATISFSVEGVEGIKAPQALTIVVGEVGDLAKFAKLYAGGLLNPPSVPYMTFLCDSDLYGTVYPGCLYYHDYDGGGESTGINKSTIDYYRGSVVGTILENGEVFLTSIEEGTVINDALAWQDYYTTLMRFPILVKEGDATNSLSDGTHFIVLKLSIQGDPNNFPNGYDDAVYVSCWMKIKVEGMKIEVLDGAMLMDATQEFKVGQK